jgi:hypoxanthine phosphoribosyltransferase
VTRSSQDQCRLPRGLTPLLSRRRIARRLTELARAIPARVPARERPVAVVVLQGAFVFAADLLRRLPADYPLDVIFVRCESYGPRTFSRGRVSLRDGLDPAVKLRGRTVLLIDDILDTGLTLDFLSRYLKRRGARKVRICVLLHRRRDAVHGIQADFAGFEVGPEFVVGYGLDYRGKYRNLPDLAVLKGYGS